MDDIGLPDENLLLRPLDERYGDQLQALCDECAAFTQEVTGLPPGPAEAQSLFIAIPPHGDYAQKRLWGVFDPEDALIGVIDASFGHPAPGRFWIGVVLLRPAWRRQGVGRALVKFLQDYAARHGAASIGLAVKADYAPAQAFWAAQDFVKIREVELNMAGLGPTMFDVLAKKAGLF
jgi:GNAT superfamily N-acetyltransferase